MQLKIIIISQSLLYTIIQTTQISPICGFAHISPLKHAWCMIINYNYKFVSVNLANDHENYHFKFLF